MRMNHIRLVISDLLLQPLYIKTCFPLYGIEHFSLIKILPFMLGKKCGNVLQRRNQALPLAKELIAHKHRCCHNVFYGLGSLHGLKNAGKSVWQPKIYKMKDSNWHFLQFWAIKGALICHKRQPQQAPNQIFPFVVWLLLSNPGQNQHPSLACS